MMSHPLLFRLKNKQSSPPVVPDEQIHSPAVEIKVTNPLD
jgi:hypothetical protein